MCGIFAAMTRHGRSSDRSDAALKLLEHRGPDGTGNRPPDQTAKEIGRGSFAPDLRKFART